MAEGIDGRIWGKIAIKEDHLRYWKVAGINKRGKYWFFNRNYYLTDKGLESLKECFKGLTQLKEIMIDLQG